jgi:DMSO/TMAO reductase YedYZ molybdopterin-dependent catalytic subunit
MHLRIEGEVIAPCELGFEDLSALPGQIPDIGELIPGRSGIGVRLGALLRRAGLKENATHVTVVSRDGEFAASVPLAAVREAIVAYRLGDAPLPAAAGGPLRFLIPNVQDCGIDGADACANVKDVGVLRVTRGAGADARRRR